MGYYKILRTRSTISHTANLIRSSTLIVKKVAGGTPASKIFIACSHSLIQHSYNSLFFIINWLKLLMPVISTPLAIRFSSLPALCAPVSVVRLL